MRLGGIHFQYYFVCRRKLWLYSKNLGLEDGHARVQDGKFLHEQSYKRTKEKELLIDNHFKIDNLDGDYVREVKLSSKMTKADKYQLLYYLYQLKLRGLVRKGLVSYTKERKTEEVILTDREEKKVRYIEADIKKIISLKKVPQVIHKPYCKKCAYYEFCYANEVEDEIK